MSIYHWVVLLLLLFGYLMCGWQKANLKYILIAVILLFCLCGLRDAYSIGGDSASSYLHQFQRLENTSWDDMPSISDWWYGAEDEENSTGHERNFALTLLMKIVYDQTDGDYQWVIIILALFALTCLAQIINRFSPNPLQSFLYLLGLMIFSLHFFALKQSVALGFVLLSFNEVVDRKPLKFLVLVTIASFFHFPALIFLPAYWIANMRIGRSYLILLVALFAVTYIFRDQFVEWMTDTYATNTNTDSGMRFLANKVLVMLLIIIAALVIRPPSPDDRIYSSLLMLMGVAAVIQTFAGYNNTFERLADYYFQFAIIFIPMVFESVETKRQYLQSKTLSLIRNFGPYVFCAFAIWRFLTNTVADQYMYPFRFCF